MNAVNAVMTCISASVLVGILWGWPVPVATVAIESPTAPSTDRNATEPLAWAAVPHVRYVVVADSVQPPNAAETAGEQKAPAKAPDPPIMLEPLATLPPAVTVEVIKPQPTRASWRYRHQIRTAAFEVFGPGAPVALLAAQIRAESAYREGAVSTAGALGIAQFMPATAARISQLYPELGPPRPLDPWWAVRAQARYMHHIFGIRSRQAATDCDAWAFTLSEYNGGSAALIREQRQAVTPTRWLGAGGVAAQQRRRRSAWEENRGYVQRVLVDFEPAYAAAGWPGGLGCRSWAA